MQGNNAIELCGTWEKAPQFSHMAYGISYLTLQLKVERRSQSVDILPIILREDMWEENAPKLLCMQGQLRSYNRMVGDRPRLLLYTFVRSMAKGCEEGDNNTVTLSGELGNMPNVRFTPLGRRIADFLLRCDRGYGRCDIVPCIAWGQAAQMIEGKGIGTQIEIVGRLQSRDYQKLTQEGVQMRTAYEVSVKQLSI